MKKLWYCYTSKNDIVVIFLLVSESWHPQNQSCYCHQEPLLSPVAISWSYPRFMIEKPKQHHDDKTNEGSNDHRDFPWKQLKHEVKMKKKMDGITMMRWRRKHKQNLRKYMLIPYCSRETSCWKWKIDIENESGPINSMRNIHIYMCKIISVKLLTSYN